jgi:predicted DCC family thiol-disulfide oxidoreductase YuxK
MPRGKVESTRLSATALRVIPLVVRDSLYELVARDRFRLFGRRQTCYLPTLEFQDRFL